MLGYKLREHEDEDESKVPVLSRTKLVPVIFMLLMLVSDTERLKSDNSLM